MVFGYESGAQAVLTCTLRAKSPTCASIVGSDARIEIDGDFYAPAGVTLVPRHSEPTRVESMHDGRGLRHQADEVARRLTAGELESPVMTLDETVSIMETMDAVRARAQWRSGLDLRTQLAERAADRALGRDLEHLAGQTLDELQDEVRG